MNGKNDNKIDFKDKENQKYFIYYLIINNKNIDNPTIKKKNIGFIYGERGLSFNNIYKVMNDVNISIYFLLLEMKLIKIFLSKSHT